MDVALRVTGARKLQSDGVPKFLLSWFPPRVTMTKRMMIVTFIKVGAYKNLLVKDHTHTFVLKGGENGGFQLEHQYMEFLFFWLQIRKAITGRDPVDMRKKKVGKKRRKRTYKFHPKRLAKAARSSYTLSSFLLYIG